MYYRLLLTAFLIFSGILCFAQNKKFTILHTSDEHSSVLPMPFSGYYAANEDATTGGFARLSQKIKEIKREKEAEDVLVFSSGDILGGSPFSWLILQNYAAEIDLMKLMGYDAVTIGNHEFDYGSEVLASYYKTADFDKGNSNTSIISSNLNIPENHPLDSILIEANKIYALSNGLKVGVFGIFGNNAYKITPKAEPIKIFDPVKIAKQQVETLRQQGADIVVALTHSGIEEDRQLAKKVKGIDVILGGHDHITTNVPEKIKGTYLFHSGCYTEYLGVLSFSFNELSRQLILDHNQDSFLIPINGKIAEDKIVAERVNYYKEILNNFLNDYTNNLFADIKQAVIEVDFEMKKTDLQESGLGNFITDGMRIAATEITKEKVDFAFQANGLIRNELTPGTTRSAKNKISFFDLAAASCLGAGNDNSPGYSMVSVYLTEKEIINALEITTLLSLVYGDVFFLQHSGLRYTYNPKKSIRFKLPFLKFPIPKFKAIYKAERYTGRDNIQDSDSYESLNRKGEKLYHVVSDYYIAEMLPKVGELLPKRAIVLKDKNGQPINLDDAVIKQNGKEFKIWESFAIYADKLSKAGKMPAYYGTSQNRIVKTNISKKRFAKLPASETSNGSVSAKAE